MIVIEDVELGVPYEDEGQWRSYHFSTEGRTLEQLEENGSISEIDQDGGEIRNYPMGEGTHQVYMAAMNAIRSHVEELIKAQKAGAMAQKFEEKRDE